MPASEGCPCCLSTAVLMLIWTISTGHFVAVDACSAVAFDPLVVSMVCLEGCFICGIQCFLSSRAVALVRRAQRWRASARTRTQYWCASTPSLEILLTALW
jgi:hypothetical protein